MSPGGINGPSLSLGNNWFIKQRDMERLGELAGVLPAMDEAELAPEEASARGFKELGIGLQQDSLRGEAIWGLWQQGFPSKSDKRPFSILG